MNSYKMLLALVLAVLPLSASAIGGVSISSTQYHQGATQTLRLAPGESLSYSVAGTWVGLAELQFSQQGADNWTAVVSSGGLAGRGNSGGTLSGIIESERGGVYRWYGSSWTSGGFVFTLADRDDFVLEIKNKKGFPVLTVNDDTITVPNDLTVSGALATTGAQTATTISAEQLSVVTTDATDSYVLRAGTGATNGTYGLVVSTRGEVYLGGRPDFIKPFGSIDTQNVGIAQISSGRLSTGGNNYAALVFASSQTGTANNIGDIWFANGYILGAEKRNVQLEVRTDGSINSGKFAVDTMRDGTLTNRLVINSSGTHTITSVSTGVIVSGWSDYNATVGANGGNIRLGSLTFGLGLDVDGVSGIARIFNTQNSGNEQIRFMSRTSGATPVTHLNLTGTGISPIGDAVGGGPLTVVNGAGVANMYLGGNGVATSSMSVVAGVVSAPSQPGARADTLSLTTAGTLQRAAFFQLYWTNSSGNGSYNKNSVFKSDAVSSDTFKARGAGVYFVKVQLGSLTNTGTNNTLKIYAMVNGTVVSEKMSAPMISGTWGAELTDFLLLADGDNVTFKIYSDDAVAHPTLTNDNKNNFAIVQKVW